MKHKPDWRNESDYPNPKSASGEVWAWEFLRRNHEYKSDYLKYSKTIEIEEEKHGPYKTPINLAQAPIHKHHYDPPKEKGETDLQWVSRCIHKNVFPKRETPTNWMKRRWMLTTTPPPPESDTPPRFLQPENPAILLNINNAKSYLPTDNDAINKKFCIGFDVSKPKTKQLRQANAIFKMLKEQFENAGGKADKTSKYQSDLWRNYLRVWDALKNGEKISTIAAVLIPHKKNNPESYNASGTISDWKRTAEKLIVGDYIYCANHQKNEI